MAYDDQDDMFGEDFDFVDEDEGDVVEKEDDAERDDEGEKEAEAGDPPPGKSKRKPVSRGGKRASKVPADADAQADATDAAESGADEEEEEPKEPPGPPADHVVHVYEFGKFTRTIGREFTSDDAVAFAVEFNRTSKIHSREAVSATRDDKPAKSL